MNTYHKINRYSGAALLLLSLTQTVSAEGVPEQLRSWQTGVTLSTNPTTATFALGANLNGGDGSLASVFNTTQIIDAHGYIKPLPADVGKKATLYAAIHGVSGKSDRWYMLDNKSNWASWVPSPDYPLIPYKEVDALSETQTVRVMNNFTGIAGQFEVYVGYQTDGDVHYNPQPLKFEVSAQGTANNGNGNNGNVNNGTGDDPLAWSAGNMINGTSSKASFSLGANVDGDNSNLQVAFNTSQLIDVYGSMHPDPADVGKPAAFFVLINGIDSQHNDWYIVDNKSLWQKWDPATAPSVSYKEIQALSATETFRVINNLTGVPAKFKVSIGYKVNGGNIHISQPLEFNVTAAQSNGNPGTGSGSGNGTPDTGSVDGTPDTNNGSGNGFIDLPFQPL